MLELGENSKSYHQEIIDHLSSFNAEDILLVGQIFSSCNIPTNWKFFDSTQLAFKYLNSNKTKNHTILLKGSRGMKLELLIEAL